MQTCHRAALSAIPFPPEKPSAKTSDWHNIPRQKSEHMITFRPYGRFAIEFLRQIEFSQILLIVIASETSGQIFNFRLFRLLLLLRVSVLF
jgi:hypothetical protein